VVAAGLTERVPDGPAIWPFAQVHETALVELQVRVVDCPALIVAGLGVRETVAGFVSEQEAVVPPLVPAHDQVYALTPFTLFVLVPAAQL